MKEVLCSGRLPSSFNCGRLKLATVGSLLHGNLQMLQIGSSPSPHPMPVAKYLLGHHCLSLSHIRSWAGGRGDGFFPWSCQQTHSESSPWMKHPIAAGRGCRGTAAESIVVLSPWLGQRSAANVSPGFVQAVSAT